MANVTRKPQDRFWLILQKDNTWTPSLSASVNNNYPTGECMHIFVGNLPAETADDELKALFEPFGVVRSVSIAVNKKTGVAEGYGIVEMAGKADARAAVDGLKGKELHGQILKVKILKTDDPFHPTMRPGFRTGPQIRTGSTFRSVGIHRKGGQRGS